MIHVAVLLPDYVRSILEGRKTIESRFSINRVEPFGRVRTGDRIYFKARGGPIAVTALAADVESREGLAPADVLAIRRALNHSILANDEYWRIKRRARFVTLIALHAVEPVVFGPAHPPFHGRAWVTLPDAECVYPKCLAHSLRRAS